jgi:hypothetical protein
MRLVRGRPGDKRGAPLIPAAPIEKGALPHPSPGPGWYAVLTDLRVEALPVKENVDFLAYLLERSRLSETSCMSGICAEV